MRQLSRALYFIAFVSGTLILYSAWSYRKDKDTIPTVRLTEQPGESNRILERRSENGFRSVNVETSHLVIQANITSHLFEKQIQNTGDDTEGYKNKGTVYSSMQVLQGSDDETKIDLGDKDKLHDNHIATSSRSHDNHIATKAAVSNTSNYQNTHDPDNLYPKNNLSSSKNNLSYRNPKDATVESSSLSLVNTNEDSSVQGRNAFEPQNKTSAYKQNNHRPVMSIDENASESQNKTNGYKQNHLRPVIFKDENAIEPQNKTGAYKQNILRPVMSTGNNNGTNKHRSVSNTGDISVYYQKNKATGDSYEPNVLKNPGTFKLSAKNDLQFILMGQNSANVSWGDEQKVMLKNKLKFFKNDAQSSLFGLHAMNASKSRSTDFDRSIIDTRSKICIHKYSDNYALKAPWKYKTVSIVIPYHNEEYSIFLRGLHSIYSRTPSHLLHEVILVDDSSTFENMKEPFENYVKLFPKLKLYRTHKRQGLIRARLLGAMLSTGDVLVFLDAHIECQTTWLEPLLDVINAIPTGIAIPTVDLIDSKTILYRLWSRRQYGTFSWELDFVWKDIPWTDLSKNATAPIKSATMIGCSMAMTRDNFFRLGAYDEDMYIWGGENLELSFRIWMCGGGLHIAPCSHVGHLFRAYLPYHFPNGDGIINKNLQRVAETWLGTYKQYYYSTVGKVIKFNQEEKQSLKSRMNFINSSLTCKPFGWYLNEIAKGVDVPTKDSVLFGQLKNLGTYSCFIYSYAKLEMEQCTLLNSNQTFYMDTGGHLVHLNSNLCIALDLKETNNNKKIAMADCDPDASHQKWLFDPISGQHVKGKLYGVDTRRPMGSLRLQFGGYQLCLMPGLVIRECDGSKHYTQFWIFTHKVNTNRVTTIL